MVSRVLLNLTSSKSILAGLSSPFLEVLHQSSLRFAHSHVSATEDTQTEAILQGLRRVAVSNQFKRTPLASCDSEALSDALTRLGLGKHAIEFVGNGKILPLAQKVQLLLSEEVTSSDLKTLLKRKAFLDITLEKLTAVFNLCKIFFSTGESAGKVLAHNPAVCLHSIERLERKFKCLGGLQLGEEARFRIAGACRGILSINEDSLQKKISFWQEIGLSVESRNRMFCRFPQILKLSLETNVQPTIDFLKSRGMDRAALLKVLVTHPEICGLSVKKNLTVKFDILRQMGFTNQECCRAISSLTQCSSQVIVSRFDTLKSKGFSAHDASTILRKYPFVFGKSEENIKKTIDYLVNVQNRDMKEIVVFPACLGYSLENRIIPRFDILKEMHVHRKYSLSRVLTLKREKFVKQFMIPQSVKIIS